MKHTGQLRLLAFTWLASRGALLLWVFQVFTLPGPDVTSDVSGIYQGWFDVLSSGSFPRHDSAWQYPPAAALAVLSPGLLPFWDYTTAFFVLACLADAVTFALLLYVGQRPGRRLVGAWVWLAGVPLLGPTAYARYDVMVTAIAVAALLVAGRRPRLAGALAGCGALVKVWPVLLLIGTPRGAQRRDLWQAAALTGLLLSVLFALTMPGAFAFVTYQRDRGVEVESWGALVFHVARRYGWEGQVQLHYGSVEFLGPYVDVVGTASLGLTALALGWLLWWRRQAVAWFSSTPTDAAFAAVLLFTTTSRVISPQYLLWLVGLAAVAMTLRGSRQGLPTALVLLATAVTVLEFPVWFVHVVSSDALGITLLLVRNSLLAAACALCCARLWRATVTEPRRRGGAVSTGQAHGGHPGAPAPVPATSARPDASPRPPH